MQGKLFQRCTHSFDCNELSLGGKVHKKTDFEAWYGIHFHKNIYEIFWSKKTIIWIFKIIKIKCFLSSSDTRRLLMHLFLFTNSAQRELVSICTQLQLTFLALKPCFKGSFIYGVTCMIHNSTVHGNKQTIAIFSSHFLYLLNIFLYFIQIFNFNKNVSLKKVLKRRSTIYKPWLFSQHSVFRYKKGYL